MATCTTYETNKACWGNFDIINKSQDLSDFAAWAIKTAANKIMKSKKVNGWYWLDANLIYEFKTGERWYFGVTHNMIFVLRVYNAEGEQTKQYVVKMNY